MKKIPTLYLADPADPSKVDLTKITPGCEWVVTPQIEKALSPDDKDIERWLGLPTRKWNGVPVEYDGKNWFALVDTGADDLVRVAIADSPLMPVFYGALDRRTGHDVFVTGDPMTNTPAGTYELCGPTVKDNAEEYIGHHLVAHKDGQGHCLPHETPFDEVMAYAIAMRWEGVVWQHPDGRMAMLDVAQLPTGWEPKS